MKLNPLAYQPFTSKELSPQGWLRRQLEIQAEGLSGHLSEIWPDIRDSSWIGGDREGWERVPYWLDGFVPLAYLLEDEKLIREAKRYIDAIIDKQQDDGWLCPCTFEERETYDLWALFLISKVLIVYYECSGDARIEGVLYRALKQLYPFLQDNSMQKWGMYRWFEGLIAIYWLYDRVHEDWLLDLATRLVVLGANYTYLFDHWKDEEPRRQWALNTHVVNLSMALKSDALLSRMSGTDGNILAEKMLGLLEKYHGMAIGHFTGDECLAGDSPLQGTELCGIVEAMYSYEVLFSITGKLSWLDRLERLAYNALPATTSPDMWTHQYVQSSNQIACYRIPGRPLWMTDPGDANLFGLEPNYGCCTANFNQGWPKFALSTFYRKGENTIISAVLAPSTLRTTVNGVPVTVTLETGYPFRDRLTYIVEAEKPVDFTLEVRIPGFCDSAVCDGKKMDGEKITLANILGGGCRREITVDLNMEFRFSQRPRDLVALERGPLLYVVPVEAKWVMEEYVRDGVERKFPYCDYQLFPQSKWNYAYTSCTFVRQEKEIGDTPFSTDCPPVEVYGQLVEIDWGLEDGYEYVCRKTPASREPLGAPQTVKLIPYGNSSLRMTELPLIKL